MGCSCIGNRCSLILSVTTGCICAFDMICPRSSQKWLAASYWEFSNDALRCDAPKLRAGSGTRMVRRDLISYAARTHWLPAAPKIRSRKMAEGSTAPTPTPRPERGVTSLCAAKRPTVAVFLCPMPHGSDEAVYLRNLLLHWILEVFLRCVQFASPRVGPLQKGP
ncbi:hypothetical protein BJ170DRAFT_55086 [Xylariales sp. AK1849]|nr:hypothetical protein BJ170DRAFT_55086 [Xylariales sp. AK1849]